MDKLPASEERSANPPDAPDDLRSRLQRLVEDHQPRGLEEEDVWLVLRDLASSPKFVRKVIQVREQKIREHFGTQVEELPSTLSIEVLRRVIELLGRTGERLPSTLDQELTSLLIGAFIRSSDRDPVAVAQAILKYIPRNLRRRHPPLRLGPDVDSDTVQKVAHAITPTLVGLDRHFLEREDVLKVIREAYGALGVKNPYNLLKSTKIQPDKMWSALLDRLRDRVKEPEAED
jgi:hypothetical protein